MFKEGHTKLGGKRRTSNGRPYVAGTILINNNTTGRTTRADEVLKCVVDCFEGGHFTINPNTGQMGNMKSAGDFINKIIFSVELSDDGILVRIEVGENRNKQTLFEAIRINPNEWTSKENLESVQSLAAKEITPDEIKTLFQTPDEYEFFEDDLEAALKAGIKTDLNEMKSMRKHSPDEYEKMMKSARTD